ncbi:hypothetical protein G7047_20890 [Diaphorobacter sp. HDW4A]|uniref:DUF5979 domain-containing protein n=1 Tax=Diaphorobacter sp. HDW4A TaxID=2714924 RepID=UPI00140E91FE|nr:DUF5979 domain-containing protein [Diaphorobacter sp. HDW4A]QIL82109.1 hypothetical protein G7047_20890 [Diaphorobacter sp. HDW4A]
MLTTNEGFANESFTYPDAPTDTGYQDDGKVASDNVATAFGLPVAPATVSTLIKDNPKIDYRYGALSIRPHKTDGSDVAATAVSSPDPGRYSTTPTSLVRVLSTRVDAVGNPTGKESVVYVPNDTKYPDRANLASIFKPDDADRYDLIIVASTYRKVTESAYAALSAVMQDPALRPNAILYFIDSCCDNARNHSKNMARFVNDLLKPATQDTNNPGALVNSLTLGTLNYDDAYTANLNTEANYPSLGSKYAEGFKTLLPNMYGGYFFTIDNVPKDNILFRHPIHKRYPNPDPGNDGYGVFFPAPQVFSGNGTCTFATVDISPFDGTHLGTNTSGGNPTSANNIGQAFINAALPGGACGGLASISTDPAPLAVTLGQPQSTITLTVKNESLTDAGVGTGVITGGRVEAQLPSNLQFAGANTVTSTCAGATATNTGTGFSVTGFNIPFKGTCTITLPVQWTDTTDPATNACIDATKNTATLTITPGVPNQFSTKEGQTNAQAVANVVCTAPELQLTTNPASLPGPFIAGSMLSYDVVVTNLSQTATASNAQLSALMPADATPTITPKSRQQFLKANPAACVSPTDCTLAPGEAATFGVQFPAPANTASMTFSPTVALPAGIPANTEVTLVNNTVTLAAPLQKQLTVQAQLTTAGSADFTSLNGSGMAFVANGCNAAPASGSAPLGINAAGTAQTSTADGASHCDVVFSSAPGPLPTGYVLASTTPTLADSNDPSTGVQTVVATWTVLPPGAANINGSITGGPSTFPPNLIGKTLDYELTCTPGAATPSTGALTVGSTGQLSIANPPMVPAGSTCTLTLKTDPATLPLPTGYLWKTPVISGSGNNFNVLLPMASSSTNGNSVPVPTLSELALYTLALLMLLAAAGPLRNGRAKR